MERIGEKEREIPVARQTNTKQDTQNEQKVESPDANVDEDKPVNLSYKSQWGKHNTILSINN